MGRAKAVLPPEKKGPGRRSKLNPALQEEIASYIRKGAFIERACQLCGIDKATYFRWLERGEKETSGPYREFLDAMTHARARVQQDAIEIVLKDALVNAESAKWFLERSFFTEWGRRSYSVSQKIVEDHDEPEEESAPNKATIKDVLFSLVDDHPEIRADLAKRLEALSP